MRIFFRGIRQFHVPGVDSALKMSTRILLGVNLPPSSADVTESGSLNLPEPSGSHRPVMGIVYLFI
jgi:hypothetical protein